MAITALQKGEQMRRYLHDVVIAPDQMLAGTVPTTWTIKVGGEPLPESFSSREEANLFVQEWLQGIKSEAEL
jgi:hypothetical protein